jgi:hypothetical protein
MKWFDVTSEMFEQEREKLTGLKLRFAYENYNEVEGGGGAREIYRAGFPEVTT